MANCNFNSQASTLEVSGADRKLHYSVEVNIIAVQEYPDDRVAVGWKGLSNISG